MQKLEVFQSMWAMQRRRPDGVEWPLAEKFAMIAAAGYDGVSIDLEDGDLEQGRRFEPFLAKHELGVLVVAFPTSTEDFREVIAAARDLGARNVTVNGRVFPYRPEEAVPQVRAWLEMGAKAGVPVYLETHRFTMTQDLLFCLQLMDLMPDLEIVADLSHHLVAFEFPRPVPDWCHGLVDRVLRRAIAFQGRVASREQAQISIEFPQNRYWLELFQGWWEKGFRYWRQRMKPDATMNFLCELGPPPYGITGPDGYEIADRWAEALVIKDWVKALWARLETEAGPA
jgi:hypothetical protein